MFVINFFYEKTPQRPSSYVFAALAVSVAITVVVTGTATTLIAVRRGGKREDNFKKRRKKWAK